MTTTPAVVVPLRRTWVIIAQPCQGQPGVYRLVCTRFLSFAQGFEPQTPGRRCPKRIHQWPHAGHLAKVLTTRSGLTPKANDMALTVLERINKEMSSLCYHMLSRLTQKLIDSTDRARAWAARTAVCRAAATAIDALGGDCAGQGPRIGHARGGCARVVAMLLLNQQTCAPGTMPGRNKTPFATNDTSRPWLTFCPPVSPTWSPFKRLCGVQWCAPCFFYTF